MLSLIEIKRLVPKRIDCAQRIWQAMRIMRGDFDVPTLALVTSTSEIHVRKHLRLLMRSGYVTVTFDAMGKKGYISTYRLVRNSGPLAPRRAITVMADPNDGQCHFLQYMSWKSPAEQRLLARAGKMAGAL